MDATSLLLDHINTLSKKDVSQKDREQIRRCLIDYLGVSFAGSGILKDKATSFISLSESSGAIQPIGLTEKCSLPMAAFVNGMFSHVAELDDGDRYGMFHPGAPLFSALFALLQKQSFPELLFEKAVICGYESSMIIARLMQPGLKDRGYHGTGIAGTIGAAIGCAVLLGATSDELTATLSAACTSASGILKVIKGQSEMKPLNVAYAAQNGLQAALLAKSGFVGSQDVLDGDLGFLNAYTNKVNQTVFDGLTSSEPLIHQIYVKPYAACRHCHSPMEVAINLSQKKIANVDEIDSVKVQTYRWAILGHDHTEITGMNSAKMSIPYSVAVALISKQGGIDLFDEPFLSDEKVIQLTNKVLVEEDLEMTAKVPDQRAANVIISLLNGEEVNDIVYLPKGEPENPVTDAELEEKMRSLCTYVGVEENIINKMQSSVKSVPIDCNLLSSILVTS